MEAKLPNNLPMRLRRYFRKTMAFPNGSVCHEGDCRIFGDDGICVCGLLHTLLPMADNAGNHYPDFEKDLLKHEKTFDKLDDLRRSQCGK